MSAAPHVIVQQRLHLQLHDPAADATALHQRAERVLLSPRLLAALDEALTDVLATAGLPASAWLTLDRLALDLTPLTSEGLETQLLEQLPALLRQHARQAVAAAAYASAPAAGAVQQASGPAATGAAWLHFLRYGTLPAHWVAPTADGWEAELKPLFRGLPVDFGAALRATLAEATARQRLMRQFSPGLVATVLVALAGPATPPVGQVGRVLASLLLPAGERAGYRGPASGLGSYADAAAEAFCLAWLARLVLPGAAPLDWRALLDALPPAALLRAAAREQALRAAWQYLAPLAAPGGAEPAGSAADAPGEEPTPTAPRASANGAAKAAPALTAAGRGGVGEEGTPEGSAAATQPGRQLPLPAATLPGRAAYGPAAGGSAPPELAVEYVANAGVVLLHPFLPACFASCNWLTAEGEQFVSAEAQAQAVLLVHFLATGRGQAPEYALRLPRLLCGVPADAPSPPRRLSLGRVARAEARALLRAAIGHWAALRDTTPAGLRAAFLQREGKLTVPPSGPPQLTVTQAAQDVLLARLPYGWGLGHVLLPWLPQPLAVSWA